MNISLVNKNLLDIIVSGYTETGEIAHFSPMMWWVYLKFENHYILLESVDGTISVDIKDQIECNFDIEEGDLFTVSSFSKSEYGLISKVDLLYDTDSNLTSLGLNISENNNYVLIDSIDFNGFDIMQKLDRNLIIHNSRYLKIDTQ